MHVKLTLLLTNSMQTKQQIRNNENLKRVSLPQLTTTIFVPPTTNAMVVRDNPSPLFYTALSLSLTIIYPSLLTGSWQPKSQEAVRTQACKWRFCVHRQPNRPTITRRGPQRAGGWKFG